MTELAQCSRSGSLQADTAGTVGTGWPPGVPWDLRGLLNKQVECEEKGSLDALRDPAFGTLDCGEKMGCCGEGQNVMYFRNL